MPTMEFSDNFNRADSTNLGASWTETTGTDIQISTNKLISSSAPCEALVATIISSADAYTQVKWVGGLTGSARPGLYVRGDADLSDGYMAQFRYSNSDILLYRKVAGSFTAVLDGTTSITYSANDVLRFEVETTGGNPVLRAYVNGVLKETYTDTDGTKITTAGYAGLRFATTDEQVDDFEAGILATTGTSTLRVNIGQTGTGVRII